ncbi:ATP/GTP-binding protein [Burkholderia sp. L27(2015)]|uniref:AAA family ATPase n=1 Tax=Burkholderia sp. L27(2015) TaxID=1641858 RepID=UPI001C207AA7|nr:AAA family ATPase [Burkholderia sp. L27(2015)]
MIHLLEIENFMSVRDLQVIDLKVGSAVCDFPERFAETWAGSGQRIPKVVAFFGANAAGKSTVRAVLKKILRDNASVIATLAQLDHPPSLALRQAAGRLSSNIFMEKLPVNEMAILQYYQANPTMLASVNVDLASIDLGIRSMSIEQGNNGPVATFQHEGLSRDVPLVLESHGTRRFLQIYPYLAHVLQLGGIAVIDELDLAIHPHVLPEILRWFYSPERNPHSAQLWMTCQNASLLENLAKEEVYFCEKDSTGGTSI